MTILEAKGKITEANNRANLIHRFDVPEGINKLVIKYSYSPRILEDREKAVRLVKECFEKCGEKIIGRPADNLPIKNLVTLSVDENGSYRGAAHRHCDSQEHIISKDFASPGFLKGEIHQGEWDIVLNVHSVSCDVYYNITVEGEE